MSQVLAPWLLPVVEDGAQKCLKSLAKETDVDGQHAVDSDAKLSHEESSSRLRLVKEYRPLQITDIYDEPTRVEMYLSDRRVSIKATVTKAALAAIDGYKHHSRHFIKNECFSIIQMLEAELVFDHLNSSTAVTIYLEKFKYVGGSIASVYGSPRAILQEPTIKDFNAQLRALRRAQASPTGAKLRTPSSKRSQRHSLSSQCHSPVPRLDLRHKDFTSCESSPAPPLRNGLKSKAQKRSPRSANLEDSTDGGPCIKRLKLEKYRWQVPLDEEGFACLEDIEQCWRNPEAFSAKSHAIPRKQQVLLEREEDSLFPGKIGRPTPQARLPIDDLKEIADLVDRGISSTGQSIPKQLQIDTVSNDTNAEADESDNGSETDLEEPFSGWEASEPENEIAKPTSNSSSPPYTPRDLPLDSSDSERISPPKHAKGDASDHISHHAGYSLEKTSSFQSLQNSKSVFESGSFNPGSQQACNFDPVEKQSSKPHNSSLDTDKAWIHASPSETLHNGPHQSNAIAIPVSSDSGAGPFRNQLGSFKFPQKSSHSSDAPSTALDMKSREESLEDASTCALDAVDTPVKDPCLRTEVFNSPARAYEHPCASRGENTTNVSIASSCEHSIIPVSQTPIAPGAVIWREHMPSTGTKDDGEQDYKVKASYSLSFSSQGATSRDACPESGQQFQERRDLLSQSANSPTTPTRATSIEVAGTNYARKESSDLFEKFAATYSEYRGSFDHFRKMCMKIQKLARVGRMEHKSLWDDFIVRNALDYRSYVNDFAENSDEVDDLMPYEAFYRDKIEWPRFTKRLVTPASIALAFPEIETSHENSPSTPQSQNRGNNRLTPKSLSDSKPVSGNSASSNRRLAYSPLSKMVNVQAPAQKLPLHEMKRIPQTTVQNLDKLQEKPAPSENLRNTDRGSRLGDSQEPSIRRITANPFQTLVRRHQRKMAK